MPVKAHNSVEKIKRYHIVVRKVYNMFLVHFPSINKKERLVLTIKSINDTAGPDGLVPTILVFGAYPRISRLERPPETTVSRAVAIAKGMQEVKKCYAVHKIKKALKTRNRPATAHLQNLAIRSQVLMYKQKTNKYKKEWKGLFQLIALFGETAIVMIKNTPTNFRTTVVKLYIQNSLDQSKDNNFNNKEVLPKERQQLPTR